jgi:hypothetical protein
MFLLEIDRDDPHHTCIIADLLLSREFWFKLRGYDLRSLTLQRGMFAFNPIYS